MATFFNSEIFFITLTFVIFWGARTLQNRTGWVLLNPVLISIGVIIAYLKITGTDYSTYRESGKMIEFWLKPAIVALGVPLYTQLKSIRRQFLPIFLSQLAGCLTGLLSVTIIARLLGATPAIVASLAPKSVTTPIAVEVSATIGGIPPLTAAIVVCVGLIGSILGYRVLSLGHINSPIARSISMGTAAHVIGTNKVAELGERHGAYATLGLILNGVLTAAIAGPLIELINL